MIDSPKLPTLAIVPLDRLLVHERHDETRTRPLIQRIRSSGVFRNPPIVLPLSDGSDRFMVLDGANRKMALQEMRFPHILVQVVELDDPGLVLQTWNHIVWEMNPQHFMESILAIPGITLERFPTYQPETSVDVSRELVFLQMPHEATYRIVVQETELQRRVELLNLLVDSYRERSRLDRTLLRDIRLLEDIYTMLCGLVLFPRFQIQDILYLASQGWLLPSGITRFTISPRALHVNYPLFELSAADTVEEKNRRLHLWLQEKLSDKRVRFYMESTVHYDE